MSASNEPPSEAHGFNDETLRAYVRGTASPEVAEAVERRATTDPMLAAEIALIRGLVQAAPAPHEQPSLELGWARLSRQVDAAQRSNPTRWLATPRFSAAQMALAAAATVALSLGLSDLFESRGASNAAFETADADQTTAPSAQITFAPSAPEQDIRGVLLEADAQIVSGPSALGVYVLEFQDEAALERGVLLLRQRPEAVETVTALPSSTAE